MPIANAGEFSDTPNVTRGIAHASEFSDSPTGGKAPGLMDDVKASADFLGNELAGVGSAFNPVNIVKGAYNTVVHPIDAAKALAALPGQMMDQYKAGDMEGLAKSIGQLAGSVAAGKALPEVPGASKIAAQTLSDGVDALPGAVGKAARVVQPVVNSPAYTKLSGGGLLGSGLALTHGNLPGVVAGLTGVGVKALVNGLAKAFPDISEESEAAPTVTPSKPASTQISSEVKISPNISVDSSANAMGTTPGKLTPETHQAMATAAKDGTLVTLPVEDQKTLVQALRNGDNSTAQQILAPPHSAVDNVIAAVKNKRNVLASYARAQGIDPSSITDTEARNAFANDAHAHGAANNLPVPKHGYRGVSPSTWNLLLESLKGGN